MHTSHAAHPPHPWHATHPPHRRLHFLEEGHNLWISRVLHQVGGILLDIGENLRFPRDCSNQVLSPGLHFSDFFTLISPVAESPAF